jgi:hypothetical protein
LDPVRLKEKNHIAMHERGARLAEHMRLEAQMFKRLSMLIVAAALLVFPRTGAAQTAPIHFSVGYQMLHIPDETYPLGFAAAVSGREDGLTWAGEVGWSRDDQNEPGVGGNLTFVEYGAGPRWTVPLANARPFVQVLAGGVHTSANLTINGAPFDASDSAFMLQPGAGVVVPFASRWGVIGQADYRRVFFKGQGENEFRLVLGIRMASR